MRTSSSSGVPRESSSFQPRTRSPLRKSTSDGVGASDPVGAVLEAGIRRAEGSRVVSPLALAFLAARVHGGCPEHRRYWPWHPAPSSPQSVTGVRRRARRGRAQLLPAGPGRSPRRRRRRARGRRRASHPRGARASRLGPLQPRRRHHAGVIMDLRTTRRRLFAHAGFGLGAAALATLFGPRRALGAGSCPLSFAPRAKRVIFLCMSGAPSQVDLFDHKPALAKHDASLCPSRSSQGNASPSSVAANASSPSELPCQARSTAGANARGRSAWCWGWASVTRTTASSRRRASRVLARYMGRAAMGSRPWRLRCRSRRTA